MLSIRKIRENIILYYESCSVASNVEREQRVRASFRVAKVCPRSTKDNKRYMMHNELLKKGKDKGKQLPDKYRYTSDNNTEWLDIEGIKKFVAPFEELFKQGKLEG